MSTNKVMLQINLCVHCNREFHHGRNLKDHSRICLKRPATEVIQKHKCTLCGREYNHTRDLTHDMHLKHPNAKTTEIVVLHMEIG